MPNTKDNAIVVKRQNFDKAMKSIKDFSDQAKEHEPLERVSYSGGLFGLGDHKVTGSELNRVVSQIEDHLIDMKNFNLGFLNLITSIYKALDALDQEHISGILIAANAAKVASDKATKNVEAIQKIVAVLQKANKKLENLEHLMDVDKAWELLEGQTELLKSLITFRDELSKLRHLKDVDKLWDDKNSQAKALEVLEKKLGEIDKTLEAQGKSISNLAAIVKGISESQQAFIDSTNKHLAERQAAIDRRFDDREKALLEKLDALNEAFNRNQDSLNKKADELSKTQADRLDSMKKAQADRLDQLETAQSERLNVIQKSQRETLGQLSEAQSTTLNLIEKAQAERLDQIAKEHKEALDQLTAEQVEKFEAINKSLEEEKSALDETVAVLTQKVRIAYILAGGAALITAIHLLLNIMGVL